MSDNRYIVFGRFYPKEDLATDDVNLTDAARHVIRARGGKLSQDALKKLYYLKREALEKFDFSKMYISSDDANPHGVLSEDLMRMEKAPRATGAPALVWNDDHGYNVMWVTHDNADGCKQARDIMLGGKRELSLAFSTELVPDERTGEPTIRFRGEHIALLGHSGHEADRPKCRVMGVHPLYPEKNAHWRDLGTVVRERIRAVRETTENMREMLKKTRETLFGDAPKINDASDTCEAEVESGDSTPTSLQDTMATADQGPTEMESAPADVEQTNVETVQKLVDNIGVTEDQAKEMVRRGLLLSDDDMEEYANTLSQGDVTKKERVMNQLAQLSDMLMHSKELHGHVGELKKQLDEERKRVEELQQTQHQREDMDREEIDNKMSNYESTMKELNLDGQCNFDALRTVVSEEPASKGRAIVNAMDRFLPPLIATARRSSAYQRHPESSSSPRPSRVPNFLRESAPAPAPAAATTAAASSKPSDGGGCMDPLPTHEYNGDVIGNFFDAPSSARKSRKRTWNDTEGSLLA